MENKVFIVLILKVYNGSTIRECKVFDNMEYAKKHFEEQTSEILEQLNTQIWKHTKDAFSFYAYYDEKNFISADIIEKEVETGYVKRGIYKYDKEAYENWTTESQNAITLWETDSEILKVEITSKAIKFFRCDDTLTVYIYPPLKELKKDKNFIENIKDLILESYTGVERENYITKLKEWQNSDNEYVLFPISFIYNSNYQNFSGKEFE